MGKLTAWRDSEGQSGFTRGNYKMLNKTQVRAERQQLKTDFPNACVDIDGYNGVDQGQEGACSLVSLINLIEVSGNQALLMSSMATVRRQWKRYWNPDPGLLGAAANDAVADLASTLDMVLLNTGDAKHAPKNKRKKKGTPPMLQSMGCLEYIPIRSEGNREQSFNQRFWVGAERLRAERFGGGEWADQVGPIQFVFEIAHLLETAIDHGEPVAVNALEHCRVLVGYNATHVLFADSWGARYTEANKRGTDRNAGGFSVVDKWLIYCWVRDVVVARRK